MDNNTLVWVLKIKQPKGTDFATMKPFQIAQLANGHWRVNSSRLSSLGAVIVMSDMKVIGDFSLGDRVVLEVKERRVTDLGLQDLNNQTKLVGHFIDYRAVNPSTIKTLGELKELIK